MSENLCNVQMLQIGHIYAKSEETVAELMKKWKIRNSNPIWRRETGDVRPRLTNLGKLRRVGLTC